MSLIIGKNIMTFCFSLCNVSRENQHIIVPKNALGTEMNMNSIINNSREKGSELVMYILKRCL